MAKANIKYAWGDKVSFVISAFMLIPSVIFLIYGFRLIAYQADKKSRCTEKVTAHVVSYNTEQRRSHKSHTTHTVYFPVYEFEYKGITYSCVSEFEQSDKQFEIGKEVEMYIDPEGGTSFYVPEEDGYRKKVIIIFVIDTPLFILGVISLVFSIRGRIEMNRQKEEQYGGYT